MIKQALEYLVGIGNTRIENVDGEVFSTQKLYKVEESLVKPIEVNSLSGVIEYLKSNFDGERKLMVNVISPTQVVCFDSFNRDSVRNNFIVATAMIPKFEFNFWHDPESINIKLQSSFIKTEDRDIMLKIVGNIREEVVNTIGDDGVSQSVVAKAGINTVAPVLVPNPVLLVPYRTFVEVEQPASNFIFRMQSGPKCALYEADGGAWKLAAMKNIKQFLEEQLDEEIKLGNVIVIA